MSRAAYGQGSVYRRGATWWITYNHRGQRVRESARSPRRADAVDLLRRRLADLGAGRVPVVASRTAFEDLVSLLERDYRLKGRRSLARAQEAIGHLRPTFGGRRAPEITAADFPAFQERRLLEGAAPATVQYELRVLRRMLNLARKQGLLREVPVFELPRIRNARQGFLTVPQLECLLAHLPGHLRPVIEFAYFTGWRVRSEVLPLRWEWVDLAAGEVRLPPGVTKNDEPRVFPFAQAGALDALLHRQAEERDALAARSGAVPPWVFHHRGRRVRTFYKAWRTACVAAGLAGRLMHDLRRSAVRNLVNAGVPEPTAMKLTGHKTREVFDRYNIVSPAETAAAVARLADFIERHRSGTNGAEGGQEAPPSGLTKFPKELKL